MPPNKMRLIVMIFMTLALMTMALSVSADEKQSQGGIAAVVDGKAITRAEVDSEMNRILGQLRRSGRSPQDSELNHVRKEVLERLIARELLYREAKKKGFKVDQEAVNDRLNSLKKRFPNETEFNKALAGMNISEEELRSQIKQGLTIKQLIDDQVTQKIAVSEKEIKDYYDNHPESFKKPEQVKASHILIKVDPKADESKKTEARKKLESVQQRLEKGEDFGALAKEFSEDTTAANGGDLGYFGQGQMVEPFEKAAFSMQPGEVSDIVTTRFGYHLIKVIDKTPETTVAYAEIKDRIEEYLKQTKTQQEVSLYVDNLEKKAKVERFLEDK